MPSVCAHTIMQHQTSEATATTCPIGEHANTSEVQIVGQHDFGVMKVCLISDRLSDEDKHCVYVLNNLDQSQ